jgi:hypothetical protein
MRYIQELCWLSTASTVATFCLSKNVCSIVRARIICMRLTLSRVEESTSSLLYLSNTTKPNTHVLLCSCLTCFTTFTECRIHDDLSEHLSGRQLTRGDL